MVDGFGLGPVYARICVFYPRRDTNYSKIEGYRPHGTSTTIGVGISNLGPRRTGITRRRKRKRKRKRERERERERMRNVKINQS